MESALCFGFASIVVLVFAVSLAFVGVALMVSIVSLIDRCGRYF